MHINNIGVLCNRRYCLYLLLSINLTELQVVATFSCAKEMSYIVSYIKMICNIYVYDVIYCNYNIKLISIFISGK